MTRGGGTRAGLASCMLLAAQAVGCEKAPLFDVGAAFALADVTWFGGEDTLFVFYELTAEQGLNDEGVVEITWTTDKVRMPWTPLDDLPTVHTHLPVDCGPDTRCGSTSIPVPNEPRDVQLRYRYHRDGALALGAPTVFNVVAAGPAWSNRSLLVYGVFDEANQHIQWRSRNQFPTLRNEQVTELGLRRRFEVTDPGFGTAKLATNGNPYGYGVLCPTDFVALGTGLLATSERAVFQPEILPLGASDASTVCAEATVFDAGGNFTTGAIARKNPEVEPAFPLLNSPVRDAVRLPFFLAECDAELDPAHETMLRQRLQLGNLPTTCIDDWGSPGFVADLTARFQDAVEAARPAGEDMVLIIGIFRDDPLASEAVEDALARVVPNERHRTTPRLAGAFVLDSDTWEIGDDELNQAALWCPTTIYGDYYDASSRSCAIAPDVLNLELGPFSFGSLPILPTRDDYLEFINDYSVKQAGEVTEIAVRVPEFAADTDHVDLGAFGMVTFLNNEIISADPEDAFSYCQSETSALVVFRSEILEQATQACEDAGYPSEYCVGVLGIESLPAWHDDLAEDTYEIGIYWEFPFLLDMQYEVVTAASVSAFGFSVPFGFGSPGQTYYGSTVWAQEEFVLEELLLQCDRFCEHPTFDSAGVYHVTDPFRTTYDDTCYIPNFPAIGDSGFPLDP